MFRFKRCRVQKKSRLHGSEPEENFVLYDVFEEGFEICINNSVSAKFLYNATSNYEGHSPLTVKASETYPMQSSKTLASFDT